MSQSATVIATYSRRMSLRLADGSVVNARIKGKRLKPVCGDRVVAKPIENEDDWLITGIDDRDNELTRPNLRGKVEVLAANVDLLIVVASVSPAPDWYVVDRYLCAAETMRIPAAVVFNKTDLLEDLADVDPVLEVFGQVGYEIVKTSADTGAGLPELRELLPGKTAIIVGQSGVGKSSLINSLVGDYRLRTSGISDKTGEGRHTTVNSVMLELPEGGCVIDSPGVRDFAPALQSATEVERGFREIHDSGHDCQFNDCRHLKEPNCAVKAGVDDGSINPRRYESYKRTLRLTDQLNKTP